MLFNSLKFALFFIVVYAAYLFLRNRRQNWLLLLASCIFYAAWDWRFLFLIFTSITVDYFCALKISESRQEIKKKRFLLLSVFVNLSILGFFKYFNFFLDTLQVLFGHFGIMLQGHFLKIILPVGISFYTFKTLSYTIDVYRGAVEPVKGYLDYALFVTYFPQLIAGPIARAKDLLPQILAARRLSLDKFYEGCYLILWGLFQKIFIADNLIRNVEPVFASSPPYDGMKVLLAVYAFSFQIYCDFAGYSNIANGLSKCMGFKEIINFNLPYFATNPADFWRRWHITLSTWIRDYIYTPIAVSKRYWGIWGIFFALMVTFLACGLWHGAGWTLVMWGGYQGMLLVLYNWMQPALSKIPSPKNIFLNRMWLLVRIIFFFHVTCLGWIIFRAQSMGHCFSMLKGLFYNFHVTEGSLLLSDLFTLFYYTWFLILVDWLNFRKGNLYAIFELPVWQQSLVYVAMYFLVISGVRSGQEFLYFKF